jgi:hypothetical protein
MIDISYYCLHFHISETPLFSSNYLKYFVYFITNRRVHPNTWWPTLDTGGAKNMAPPLKQKYTLFARYMVTVLVSITIYCSYI